MTIKSSKQSLLKPVLIFTVIFCLLLPLKPSPAHAEILQWSIVDTPSSLYNIIVSPSEITDIAISPDGITVYAVDTPHSKVYKSADGGITWVDISSSLTDAGATLPAWNLVTAPDNPNIVAAVTSIGGVPRNVFISFDSGTTWQNTNCPVTNNISAVDISINYGNYDIAVGTRTLTGSGNIYIFRIGVTGTWKSQGFTADILAAKFSPNYVTDSSLVIIYANNTGTYINIGLRDTAANTTIWNSWGPVEITTFGPGTSPKANQIDTADLQLPLDFLGQIAGMRRIYVCTNDAGASGNTGIYRADDTLIYQLMAASGNKMFSSIAYHGSYNAGKLLAAETKADPSLATVDIWYCSNPEATCPQATCLLWQKAVKPPTGGGNTGYANAQVAWSIDGSRAYCGTSSANIDIAGWPNGYKTVGTLDESAFSITLDNNISWNQLSLIDTRINFLSDVVVSVNSDAVYLASINTSGGYTGFDSLWRSTSYPTGLTWERVLCVLATANDTILRMGPAESGQPISLADRSTSDLYYSTDNGQTWDKAFPGINITDFTITQINGSLRMYVLDGNSVRRGEYLNQIWKWSSKVNSPLSSGHTILATAKGIVLVGDAATGMLVYSTDGGTQFTQLPPIPQPGNVHAVVDTRIGNYLVVYAATDAAAGSIYYWIGGVTPGWTSLVSPDQSFYGLAQIGTLYGAWSSGGNSGVDRTLNPEDLGPPITEWGRMTSGLTAGVVFTREPTSLKASDGVDLWAIDNRSYSATTGRLWTYRDCLTPVPQQIPKNQSQEVLLQAPAPVLPSSGDIIPIDPDTDKVADIEFKWKHPTPANRYDLWIATDEDFKDTVIKKSVIPDTPLVPNWILSSTKSILEAGKTYYWKVRVSFTATYEPARGEWSQVMSFSTEEKATQEIVEPGPILLSPPNGSEGIDRIPTFSWKTTSEATEYEFILATDESLNQVIDSKNIEGTTYNYGGELAQNTTYFWQVKVSEPYQSEPSPIFSFTVSTEIETEPPIQKTVPPIWLWIVIGVVVIIAASILFITRNRWNTTKT